MKRVYWTFILLTIISLVLTIILGILLITQELLILFSISVIFFLFFLFISVGIYFKNVKFECPVCHTIFKSNKREIFWAIHTPTKRKMYCPNCKTKKWCKDIFDD